MGVGLLRRLEDLLFAGVPTAVADVVEDRLVEQLCLLRHQGNPAAEVLERHIRERHAIDEDLPLRRVVEPADEVDHRALAAAVGADNRHPLAEVDRDADVVEDGVDAVVAKGDVFEADLPVRTGERARGGGFVERRGGVEERVEGLGADDADVHPGEHSGELADRVARADEHPEKHHDARHRHRPLAHRDPEDLRLLVDDEPGPDGDRRRHHADAENLGDRIGQRVVEGVLHARVEHVLCAGAEALPLKLLHRIGLDGEDVIERLEENMVKAERLREDVPRNRPDPAIQPHHHEADGRGERETGERQLPGNAKRPRQAGENLERLGDRAAEDARDPAGEHLGGAGDLGHEAGRPMPHELGPVDGECLVEHFQADVPGDVRRHPRHEERADEQKGMLEKRADNDECHHPQHRCERVGGEEAVEPGVELFGGIKEGLIGPLAHEHGVEG